MLDDRAIDRMDEHGLRQYIKTLHEALRHVGAAMGQAEQIIRQSSTPPKSNGSDPALELARAMISGGRT